MVDKGTIIQVLGGIMHNPELLAQKDRYVLTPEDFTSSFEKVIFISIHNLFENGAKNITAIDVDNYLNTNPVSRKIFDTNHGIEYLEDVYEYSDPENFPFYYNRLKKLRVLSDLKKKGYDITKVYDENLVNKDATKINMRFEELTLQDILDIYKAEISEIEVRYNAGDTSDTIEALDGLEDLIEQLKLHPDTGAPLQGPIFNTIAKGARKGKYYIRSAASATGKTRLAVGDACYLSYPIRFNPENWEWEINGSSEKTLFIMTEQEFDEIQTMILAYLTGFNEEKILYGRYDIEESKIVKQALKVMEYFKDNLRLVQMPNPNIAKVQAVIRENHRLHQIENVFYDYIFVGPALLNEFRDLRIRNDEALLMFSTALKDLAVELNIFIMSSTQLNAKGEESETGSIKNESAIRGSRAIIDKCDVGVIVSRITKDQLSAIEDMGVTPIPNQVVDVFKVRRGRFTQVRIWMDSNLGNCRRDDILITDSYFNVVKGFSPIAIIPNKENYQEWKEILEEVRSIDG